MHNAHILCTVLGWILTDLKCLFALTFPLTLVIITIIVGDQAAAHVDGHPPGDSPQRHHVGITS